jgi:predicted RNA-binding protein associated with RNAse of E/G family
MRNYDEYYMRSSTERFARFKEAYTSPNACRSILLPRDNFQSLMFDNETSHYCITGGNDRKIRYWNLVDPESQSY